MALIMGGMICVIFCLAIIAILLAAQVLEIRETEQEKDEKAYLSIQERDELFRNRKHYNEPW